MVGQHDCMICMMLGLALTGIQGKSFIPLKTWTAFCHPDHAHHAYHAAAYPMVA
jgi:hypothetical protein